MDQNSFPEQLSSSIQLHSGKIARKFACSFFICYKKFTKQTKRQFTGTVSLFSPDADLDPEPTFHFAADPDALDLESALIKVMQNC
jgi:hypothetical protein